VLDISLTAYNAKSTNSVNITETDGNCKGTVLHNDANLRRHLRAHLQAKTAPSRPELPHCGKSVGR